MHRIIKPEPVSEELTIGFFIVGLSRTDDSFTLDWDGMKAMESIVEAVQDSEDEPHIDIEDAHWERLVKAAKQPKRRGQPCGYGLEGAVEKLTPYLRAIIDAKKVKREITAKQAQQLEESNGNADS